MNPYTVIYTDGWMSGSHQHVTVKYRHVEAEDVLGAYALLCGPAILVFPGHITPLGCEQGENYD